MQIGFRNNFPAPSLTAQVGMAFRWVPDKTRRLTPEQMSGGVALSSEDQVILERAQRVISLVDSGLGQARDLDQKAKDKDPQPGKVDSQILAWKPDKSAIIVGQFQADLTSGAESFLLHTSELRGETLGPEVDLYFKQDAGGRKIYGGSLPEVGQMELLAEPNGTLVVTW